MSSSKILRDKKARPFKCYAMEEISGRKNPNEGGLQADEILKENRRKKEAIEMEAYRQGLEKGQAEGQKMAFKLIPHFITFSFSSPF